MPDFHPNGLRWPTTVFFYGLDGNGPEEWRIPVVPSNVAETLADALGRSMEGDLSGADEALALYERTVSP